LIQCLEYRCLIGNVTRVEWPLSKEKIKLGGELLKFECVDEKMLTISSNKGNAN
jgi:hypothetical protein